MKIYDIRNHFKIVIYINTIYNIKYTNFLRVDHRNKISYCIINYIKSAYISLKNYCEGSFLMFVKQFLKFYFSIILCCF